MEPTSAANQQLMFPIFFRIRTCIIADAIGAVSDDAAAAADAVSIIYTNETSFRFDFISILQKWDHFESWFCIKSSNKKHLSMQVF